MQSPSIKPINPNQEFYVITDASKLDISAILAQKTNDNLFRFEFYGRKLRDAETKYATMKLKFLSMHEGLMHFRYLVLGYKINTFTDSKALTYYISLEK